MGRLLRLFLTHTTTYAYTNTHIQAHTVNQYPLKVKLCERFRVGEGIKLEAGDSLVFSLLRVCVCDESLVERFGGSRGYR